MASFSETAEVLQKDGRISINSTSEQYVLQDVLGEGGYGTVYRGTRHRDGGVFAVKMIDATRIGFKTGGACAVTSAQAMAAREVEVLQTLSGHPGIISFEGVFCSASVNQFFIITEFVPGGDLFSYVVQRADPLQEKEAAHIVAQLADALSFCHSKGVVHHDLKLENVLVAKIDMKACEHERASGTTVQVEKLLSVKICDFGFAKRRGMPMSPFMHGGTSNYAAPECIQGAARDQVHSDPSKADAFALGVVTFVMLCQEFPSTDGDKGSHKQNKQWLTLSDVSRSLMDRLLHHDPSKRCSVTEVCTHPWIIGGAVYLSILADGGNAKFQHPSLPGLLALQRGFVLLQRERAIACCATTHAPSFDGSSISVFDQFRSYVKLTEKRMAEARDLLGQSQQWTTRTALCALLCDLSEVRDCVISGVKPEDDSFKRQVSVELVDKVLFSYNRACFTLIGIVATALTEVQPDSAQARSAARRYRLFSEAAEQLGRERSFVIGHGQLSSDRSESMPTEHVVRLAEIIGARKVLLGTARDYDSVASGDILTTSTGILGTLIDDGEAPLLSSRDMVELESIESKVLSPCQRQPLLTEEWYQTLTRLINGIHSRIAINLVKDTRLIASPGNESSSGSAFAINSKPPCDMFWE